MFHTDRSGFEGSEAWVGTTKQKYPSMEAALNKVHSDEMARSRAERFSFFTTEANFVFAIMVLALTLGTVSVATLVIVHAVAPMYSIFK